MDLKLINKCNKTPTNILESLRDILVQQILKILSPRVKFLKMLVEYLLLLLLLIATLQIKNLFICERNLIICFRISLHRKLIILQLLKIILWEIITTTTTTTAIAITKIAINRVALIINQFQLFRPLTTITQNIFLQYLRNNNRTIKPPLKFHIFPFEKF